MNGEIPKDGSESNNVTVIVPLPAADAVVLPGVPGPPPPVDAVAVPVGLVLVLVSMPVTAAPLDVMKNGRDVDVPPPGAGLKTLISIVPTNVSRPDGTTAVRLDGEL